MDQSNEKNSNYGYMPKKDPINIAHIICISKNTKKDL